VTIQGFSTNKNNGIFVLFTDYSDFRNLSSSDNYYGIYLEYSNRNTIINNSAFNNSRGIFFSSSMNNNISNNTVKSNEYEGITFFNSSNNTALSNNITSNGEGIRIRFYSNANKIIKNNVDSNLFGIYTWDSSNDNQIYDNLFNNSDNVYFGNSISNTWNTTNSTGPNILGGPYIGGNFWGAPDGTGFSDTCDDHDSDGFCDDFYNLSAGNIDWLPLSGSVGQDVTAPAVTIHSPANTSYTDKSLLLNATFSEAVNHTWYLVDGGNLSNATANTTNLTLELPALDDGSHNVTVYANDSKGNINSSTVFFTIDTPSPVTPSSGGGGGGGGAGADFEASIREIKKGASVIG
jgi:parallel beta-helix repeat protein